MDKSDRLKTKRSIVVIAIMIPIALLHLVTGSQYQGPFPLFVNGYMIDILLPFGFYLLLCLNDVPILNSWIVRGLLVFFTATAVELVQYQGIQLLGQTFDPLDILMYGLGVLLAVLCDQLIFPRLFSFWRSGQSVYQPDDESEQG
jgi:hypothetical protein